MGIADPFGPLVGMERARKGRRSEGDICGRGVGKVTPLLVAQLHCWQ